MMWQQKPVVVAGFEPESSWAGYPGSIKQSSAILTRKDINIGYEHR